MIVRERKTKETSIKLKLDVAGSQKIRIQTGHGFFDHMLHQLAFHSGWDLELTATGDLDVDDHHMVEDVALVIGSALQEAWRACATSDAGMRRYGQRLLPMDDVLVLCAVDLSGRPYSKTRLRLKRESVGGLACEMVDHFFLSLAVAGCFTLHIRKITGKNHHHIIEASFKALAQALREALSPAPGAASTKGVL